MIDVVEDVSYGLLVSSCVRLGVVVSVFVVVARRQNCKNKTDKTLLFLTHSTYFVAFRLSLHHFFISLSLTIMLLSPPPPLYPSTVRMTK